MTSTGVIRVALTDDHAVVREGLAALVGANANMEVVLTVATGRELLLRAAAAEPDVCVLDLSLPDGDGLDLLGRLRGLVPGVAILVLTAHSEAAYGSAALDAGADGFLNKACEPSEIVRAIRELAQGRMHVPQELASLLVRGRGRGDAPPHTSLSPRELTVLVRLAAGSSNAEISAELHLDQRTISTYRRRVLDKLDLRTNADLVRYALRHGLVDADPPVDGGP